VHSEQDMLFEPNGNVKPCCLPQFLFICATGQSILITFIASIFSASVQNGEKHSSPHSKELLHTRSFSTHTVCIEKLAMPDVKATIAHNRMRPTFSLATFGNLERADQFEPR
jgi:hypothetical protein